MYFEHLCHAEENGMDASVRFFVSELISRLAWARGASPALDTVLNTLESFITTELDCMRWNTPG